MLSDSESVSSPQLLPDRAASDSGLHLISCSPRAAAASLPSRGGGPLADGGLLIKAGMICQWETKQQVERTWLKKTETQNSFSQLVLVSVCVVIQSETSPESPESSSAPRCRRSSRVARRTSAPSPPGLPAPCGRLGGAASSGTAPQRAG